VEAAYAVEDFEGGIWRLKDFSPIFYRGRTRRPAKVQRFYLGFASFRMKSLELAGGELKPYFERRMEVNNEVRKILEGSGTPEDKAEALISLGIRYGLDAEDLPLLVEDAARDGAVSREELLKITSIIGEGDFSHASLSILLFCSVAIEKLPERSSLESMKKHTSCRLSF